ncbi:hypothetical protein [Mesorhizobium sp. B2-3-15]|uniref:hypothetical protein n=1 Tax=Mesorhizobium sp. B2-3-15 TaxID=2589949 RepID=UPI00112C795A|nr:hypothetical protein [Mesorhizobium sp. B2-3-15]TPL64109.1 hypothetical protein FJ954_29815 [Mesorhizobium sp. B2-3-15]
MKTQSEALAIPDCVYVDETFAASIFGFDMDRLYYVQSWCSFPIPIKVGNLLVVRTADIERWARNRNYRITRYTI